MIVTPGQLFSRANFYHQLAQLVAAGVGVTQALQQIRQHPPGFSFRAPLQRTLNALAEGKPLSQSLREADWLPEFDVTLIEAGEQSGRIDSSFRTLADYYNERGTIARQIIMQMLYPAFLIHFAALIFLVVIPFASPFGDSHFSANPVWLLIRAALCLSPIYLGVALMIYAGQSKHGEYWRGFLERILRPVPLLGSGRHALALSRLAMALEALISAGVNIVEAWNFAAAAGNSPALKHVVAAWKEPLASGQTPAELVNASHYFPATFANLYLTGETTGKLDETLQRLHVFYRDESSHKIKLVTRAVCFAVYFAVVLVIAYFIISFYQHLYGGGSELDQVIHGFGN